MNKLNTIWNLAAKAIAVGALALVLTACGSAVEGNTYEADSDLVKFSMTFGPGGKVAMTTMGIETEMDYEIDGKKIKIGSPQGKMVLTLREDGVIEGWPSGLVLKQKK